MENQTVTINDQEYNVADFTEEQQYFLAQVNDIRAKLQNLRFQMDQLAVSEKFFTDKLVESVQEPAQDNEEVTVN